MTKKIAIIYHGSYSNTLSEHIQKGAEGVKVVSYDVEHIDNLNLLDDADAIIFGSPTYFGSVSASMKNFMDSTIDIWENKKWNNKIAAGFTYSSALDGNKLSALMTIFTFAEQHGMIWVGLDLKSCEKKEGYNTELNRFGSWAGLMAQSPHKNNQADNLSDLQTAEYFGARIAEVIKKFG